MTHYQFSKSIDGRKLIVYADRLEIDEFTDTVMAIKLAGQDYEATETDDAIAVAVADGWAQEV